MEKKNFLEIPEDPDKSNFLDIVKIQFQSAKGKGKIFYIFSYQQFCPFDNTE